MLTFVYFSFLRAYFCWKCPGLLYDYLLHNLVWCQHKHSLSDILLMAALADSVDVNQEDRLVKANYSTINQSRLVLPEKAFAHVNIPAVSSYSTCAYLVPLYFSEPISCGTYAKTLYRSPGTPTWTHSTWTNAPWRSQPSVSSSTSLFWSLLVPDCWFDAWIAHRQVRWL